MKSLTKLLSAIHILASVHEDEKDIEQIAYHSNKVKKQTLFVCVPGHTSDGHAFAKEAVQKGAVALIVEDFLEGVSVPQYKVRDARIALAALADAFYDHPSQDLNIIGITATNGKTSTSFMVDAIFEEAGYKTGLIGTVMVKYGDTVIPSVLTTPESLDLQSDLYAMKKQDVTHVTMEVSSSALELHRVGSVSFDYVALNNISREHIDLHGSFSNYFRAKASLIRQADKHQWAILNLDDRYSKSLINETKASVWTYGIENKQGDLSCTDIDLSTGKGTFTVHLNREIQTKNQLIHPQSFEIALSVAGYHSIYNSLVAISIGLLNGVPIYSIQKALERFKEVERRFQMVYNQEFIILDDHFANPGNIEVTLNSLVKMTYGTLYLVYAIRGSRGVTTNKENMDTLIEWLPRLGSVEIIGTLSQEYVTGKDTVQEEEVAVFEKTLQEAHIPYHLHDTLEDAVKESLDRVGAGDVILLAGSQGMDIGAHIALHELALRKPESSRKEILAPLETRTVQPRKTEE